MHVHLATTHLHPHLACADVWATYSIHPCTGFCCHSPPFWLCSREEPHAPACLLKYWLQHLDDALFPTSMYPQCIDLARSSSKLEDYATLIASLPAVNRNVITFLVEKVVAPIIQPDCMTVNKMGIGNLAVVFGPSFLRNPSGKSQPCVAPPMTSCVFLQLSNGQGGLPRLLVRFSISQRLICRQR